MFHFLTNAAAPNPAGGMTGMIFMLVGMFALMYFMVMRPENKRKKEAEQMRNSIKVGDRITTIGGVVGVVISVKDDTFVVETGDDRVRIEFTKWAISTNDSAAEAAKAKAKKDQEAKAKAKAAKNVEKNTKN